jgi:SAM-dependent methyltransferase
VKILPDYNDEIAELQRHIHSQSRPGETLKILEAGCGREWYFRMEGVPYELTGIDLDSDALAARMKDKHDMHRAEVGDLRTIQLPEAHYDVIYNAFVLEHVPGAAQVLENFCRWLKPGGLLIVRVPDRDSVQGVLARWTPHWVHVLYYRWAWKMPNAGKPGYAPYPTIYDAVVSRSGMRQFLEARGLRVDAEIGSGSFARGYGLAQRITPIIARLISWFSLGRVHDRYVDFSMVARKTAAPRP